MKMTALKSAAAPYLLYILLAAFAVTVVGTVMVTSKVKDGKFATEKAGYVKKIADKDLVLQNSANALRGSAAAIREINAEADRRIAEERATKQAFADAANAATEGRKRAEANIVTKRKEWERARKNETCRLLLDTDIVATCGVKL